MFCGLKLVSYILYTNIVAYRIIELDVLVVKLLKAGFVKILFAQEAFR